MGLSAAYDTFASGFFALALLTTRLLFRRYLSLPTTYLVASLRKQIADYEIHQPRYSDSCCDCDWFRNIEINALRGIFTNSTPIRKVTLSGVSHFTNVQNGALTTVNVQIIN